MMSLPVRIIRMTIVSPVAAVIPVAAPIYRTCNDRRITHDAGRIKAPPKWAIKRTVSRQPGVRIKSGVPEPAGTIHAAEPIIAPTTSVATHRSRLSRLVARGRFVFGTNVTPGVQFVFLLGIEFLSL